MPSAPPAADSRPTTVTAPPSGDSQTAPTQRRVPLLDGVRGIAIVLVVLSHGWTLWPIEWIDSHEWVRPIFRSGNYAVTIFLVAAGYLTYVGLSSRGLPRMRPDVALVRRVLRVAPSLWLMLAAVLVVSTLDSTEVTSSDDNVDSVLHVLTYTWNWYVQGNLLSSRPDFGHLWYLSVDMQAFVIMALFLYMMRRRTVALLWALGGFLLLLTWWRVHVNDTEYVFQVLVRTTARMDPFVVGVMLGAALPLLRRANIAQAWVRLSAIASLLLLVPLAWVCSADDRFLTYGVTLLELDLAVLFGATALLAARTPAALRAVATRPLAFLGRHSLLLYIWHYPVFTFVARHSEDWSWQARTAAAFALTIAVCLLAHALVERRVTAMLAHPRWAEVRDGLPAYAKTRLQTLRTRPRRQA